MDFVAARPFLIIGPGLVIGCLVASGGAESRLDVHLCVLAAALIVAALLKLGRAPPPAMLAALLASSMQVGLLVADAAEHRAVVRGLQLRRLSGRIEVAGVLLSEPFRTRGPRAPPWGSGDVSRRRGPWVAEMAVERVGGAAVECRVRVSFEGAERPPPAGTAVIVAGKLTCPGEPGNPGEVDPRIVAWTFGSDASLWIASGADVKVVEDSKRSPWIAWVGWIRGTLCDRFLAACGEDVGGFLCAILLGVREGVAPYVRDRLQVTGAAHVLAVSGQNLSMVLPLVWGVLHVGGVRLGGRSILTVLVAAAFAVMTGMQSPVLRCFVMVAVLRLAPLGGRVSDPANSLGLAAALLALADPLSVKGPGFQLTFAAVGAMMAFTPVLADGLGPAGGGRLAGMARTSLAVSAAAWLGTMPLVLVHFNMVSGIGVAASLFIIPLIFVQMLLGAVLLLWPSPVLAWPTAVTYDVMVWGVDGLSRFPGAYDYFAAPPAMAWVVVAAAFAAALSWRKPLFVVPALVAVVAIPGRTPPPEACVRLTMIDVRRGAAVAAEFPDGSVVLVDCGSLDSTVPERRWIGPALWSMGISKIDAVVLTHPDLDHVNGLAGVVDMFRVRRILVGEPFLEYEGGRRIRDYLKKAGIRVGVVTAEPSESMALNPWMRLLPPAPWKALGRDRPATNETSLAATIEISGRRALLLGDSGAESCGYLMAGGPPRSIDILLVPHHGKFHVRHSALADHLRPTLALISAPKGYGDAGVVAALRGSGARILETGGDGAVQVVLGPSGMTVRTFRGTDAVEEFAEAGDVAAEVDKGAPGGPGGVAIVLGVAEHQGAGRGDRQGLRRGQQHVGRGLGAGDVAAGDDGLEQGDQAYGGQDPVGDRAGAVGDHGGLEAPLAEAGHQVGGPIHDAHGIHEIEVVARIGGLHFAQGQFGKPERPVVFRALAPRALELEFRDRAPPLLGQRGVENVEPDGVAVHEDPVQVEEDRVEAAHAAPRIQSRIWCQGCRRRWKRSVKEGRAQAARPARRSSRSAASPESANQTMVARRWARASGRASGRTPKGPDRLRKQVSR